MKWNRGMPKNEIPVVFTDGEDIYFGKVGFNNHWNDYELGIISNPITGWSTDLPEAPSFVNGTPLNGDYKGWNNAAATLNEYVWICDQDSKITIARFDYGWFNRKGEKIDTVMCSLALPHIT